MKVNEIEMSISLGRNSFIVNWLDSIPNQNEAFLGSLVIPKKTSLCLEGLLSPRGKMQVEPSSIVTFFTVPEEEFDPTSYIPQLLFKTTSYHIDESRQGSSELITNHYSDGRLIAQSYIAYETELKLYRIVMVIHVKESFREFIYNSLKNNLENI